jgi:hypothetical protein
VEVEVVVEVHLAVAGARQAVALVEEASAVEEEVEVEVR